MKFFFSFYFILLFTSVNAQIDEPKPPKEPESPQLPRIVAPTPEASSLMKFGEIPVNYSSGLYNLSVPVYSIGTPDLTLPIALKYHSQGVMVNETASSVGISWSLSAGGSISRQIRGKPDDGGVGYLNGVYDNFFTSNTKRVTVFNQLTSLTTPQKDLLPDKFSINLPTISGTFIFDHQTGEARLKSLQNVAIYPQKNQGRITGFELVDGKGIRYIFEGGGRREDHQTIITRGTTPEYIDSSLDDYFGGLYTSWNLTEIQLLNGKKISFNYHPESHYLTYNTVKDEHANGQLTTTINVTKNIERYLKSITYHKTRVEFIYSQDNREDIYNDQNGAKALERIKVFMRKDNSAVLNKDIELKQSYFSSTTQSEQNLPNYFNSGNHSLFSHAQKRLRLDEVINHHLSDTSESLRYKFNYNSTAIAHKFTTAQDYWGYYNGADNGNNLVFGEADRRVNPTYTKLGLIESVEYPTGLVKKFTYEPQAGYISSKLQHLETELINPSGQNPTNHVSASPLNYNTYFNHSQNAYIIPFNIGNDATNFSYKVEKTDFYTSENSQSNSNVIYLFKIINPVNNTIVWDYRLDETDCLTTESFQQGRSCDGSWNWTPSLPTGNYVLKVETESGNYDPESYEGFNFIMNWEDNEYPEHYLVGPGSRVKQIESYETGSPRNLAVDQFDYETDLGKDSGYIFGLPNYFVSFDYPSAPSTGPDNTYDVITGNYTNSLFNNFQGRKHVYSQVIVKTGTKTAQQNNGEGINIPTDIYHFNGEKVLSYSVNDDFNDFTDYPFVLADSNSWIDGQLLNERSFSYSKNGNKQLLKEVDYHYSVDYESHESLLTNGPSFMHPDQGNLSGNTINQNYSDVFQSPHWSKGHSWKIPLAAFYYEGFPFNVNATVPVNYKVYYITGGYLKLNSVTEDRYYYKNSSTHKVSTTTHFEYYNSEFNFSTKSKDYVSYNDGTIIEQSKTNYYYPDILPQWYNTDWNVQALIDDHRISSPIAVVTYNNNTLTSRLAKQFDPSPILKETFFSKGKQALDSKIKYEQYDQDSNVLQVRQTGDVPISYIYGYHNSKPIAKLVNIAYNQINPSLISSLQAAADADANCLGANCQQTEDDLRNLLEQLRSTYSNAQITTYTYDPLIGVTSVTDPRGQSLYYEYGAFNRLERIKDEQGHIVEEYDYNYRQTSNQ